MFLFATERTVPSTRLHDGVGCLKERPTTRIQPHSRMNRIVTRALPSLYRSKLVGPALVFPKRVRATFLPNDSCPVVAIVKALTTLFEAIAEQHIAAAAQVDEYRTGRGIGIDAQRCGAKASRSRREAEVDGAEHARRNRLSATTVELDAELGGLRAGD